MRHLSRPLIAAGLSVFLMGEPAMAQNDSREPGWYRKLAPAPSRLVGYGNAPTREQAVLSAREEAAAQLGVEVQSAVSRRIVDDNRKVSAVSESRAESKVARRLNNTRVLREEQIGGIHFVAIEADLRDTQKRLADEIMARYGKVGRFTGPSQIAGSPLLQGVRELSAGAEKSTPSVELALSRSGDDWRLRAGDLTLTIDREDLHRLIDWSAAPRHTLALATIDARSQKPVDRLQGGRAFYLRLANPSARTFYSIFNVYVDGRVTLLAENLTVEAGGRELGFPSAAERERGTALEAARTDPRTIDTDTYLVVASPAKLQNQRILSQKDRVVVEGSSYAADLLLNLLATGAVTAYGAASLLIE